MNGLLKAIQKQSFKDLLTHYVGFQYRVKTNRLVARNNELHLNSWKAYSYGWWCYVKEIDGLLIFNEHKYSMTTSGHQGRMETLLSKLGRYPSIKINTRSSIEGFTLEDVKTVLKGQIVDAKERLAGCVRPKSMKRDRIEEELAGLQYSLNTVAIAQDRAAGRFVEVTDSSGYKEVMTETEYAEYRLQLSTGDFHTHKAKFLKSKKHLKLA